MEAKISELVDDPEVYCTKDYEDEFEPFPYLGDFCFSNIRSFFHKIKTPHSRRLRNSATDGMHSEAFYLIVRQGRWSCGYIQSGERIG